MAIFYHITVKTDDSHLSSSFTHMPSSSITLRAPTCSNEFPTPMMGESFKTILVSRCANTSICFCWSTVVFVLAARPGPNTRSQGYHCGRAARDKSRNSIVRTDAGGRPPDRKLKPFLYIHLYPFHYCLRSGVAWHCVSWLCAFGLSRDTHDSSNRGVVSRSLLLLLFIKWMRAKEKIISRMVLTLLSIQRFPKASHCYQRPHHQ